MGGFEWYLDFVDKGFEPGEEHLLALFRVEPAPGMSLEEAAGRVASESSIGTWTTLTTLTPEMRGLMARAYWFDGPYVKIAYPLGLFEEGSIPQLLSSVAGNVFGMRALRALRLVDLRFPASYLEYFKGPQHGIRGVRRLLGVSDRPITATVPEPKVGLTPQQYAEAAYQAWVVGIDLVKDD
ncbi:MAG: RuBisCO large subunit C-terminal-like domain-containing protein [Candidatus Korarchaeota archaeon]|nr:RuBisCO large subunit C-terminal-like domain-containing protein [Candidatus Korarchaeota archaeon]